MGKLILGIIFLFSVNHVQAGMIDDIKSYLRPHLENILGVEQANKLLGKDDSDITLPKIPKVKSNAKSTDVYNDKPKNEVKYEEKQKRRFNYVFVEEVFKATRRIEAKEEDIARWMNVLEQNGSREGVYRALVLDNTYLGLENYEFPVTDGTVQFTKEFIGKYLDKSISEEALKKANFFTVKRDITEKTLEVIDELFRMKGDEVYDWYAVFSADLAKRFPKIMNNDTRKSTDPVLHKKWAQSVPDQFLKSEVIIKLHRAFNRIQG